MVDQKYKSDSSMLFCYQVPTLKIPLGTVLAADTCSLIVD